jgi:curved DNA-binding protein CbpA
MTPLPGPGPFATLGLPARAGLTDDEVRAAWRRVAAATHPDRADGGDPARFAAAAAAYTALRTRSGRAEALTDLAGQAGQSGQGRRNRGGPASHPGRRMLVRIRRGRPVFLALRLAIAAAVSAATITLAGLAPATPAVITGAITWLLLTARHDLAPPP